MAAVPVTSNLSNRLEMPSATPTAEKKASFIKPLMPEQLMMVSHSSMASSSSASVAVTLTLNVFSSSGNKTLYCWIRVKSSRRQM
eukprot:53736-Eustigmatos_ZCMA.PRE.1